MRVKSEELCFLIVVLPGLGSEQAQYPADRVPETGRSRVTAGDNQRVLCYPESLEVYFYSQMHPGPQAVFLGLWLYSALTQALLTTQG